MRQEKRCRISFLLFAVLLAGMGCGGQKSVEGIVLLNDTPVPGATVSFFPEDDKGRPCSAITDSEGKFQVKTGGEQGVAPGKYKVVVMKTEGGDDAPVSPRAGNPQEMEEYVKRMKEGGKVKSLLPEEYGNPKKTPFSVTVPLESTPLRLELKKKK
jgi:hypothetical protein